LLAAKKDGPLLSILWRKEATDLKIQPRKRTGLTVLKAKHNVGKNPELSGTSAQTLAALRAEKSRRTPSFIIKHRRAAQALAATRMSAKVAVDKFDARAGEIAEVTS